MSWIDQNLDAYRVIAEILTDFRPIVRERLEAKHGKEWFKDGIPEPVFDRLIRNKEQETSIDWYENRYQEVIDYAVFSDLFEIVTANPALFRPILKLAPTASLLSTRFLELEVMRAKIARARQISEAEINFLTSFHLRFRKAIQLLKGAPLDDGDDADQLEVDLDDDVFETADEIRGEPSKPAAKSMPEPEAPQVSQPPPTKERPPLRLATPNQPETPPQASPAPETAQPEVEPPPKPVDDDGFQGRETSSAIVQRAMEEGDDQAVLRELYREITGIAEVIWTTENIPTTRIWERVSTNKWYEENFSRLELRTLSDFYELISQVRERRKNNIPKKEMQTFLNDSNFAKVLLGLRDMFQKNQI